MNNTSAKTLKRTFQPTRILSVSSSATLLGWVQRRLKEGDKALLIDFCNVMFMDSTGLGTLVTAVKLVQQAEGRLAVCSLGGQARMLFETSGMAPIIEVFDTPEDFEQSLSSTSTSTVG